MEQAKLNEILKKHEKWLTDITGGEKADFHNMNLNNMNFSNHILMYANFKGANCKNVDFRDTNLSNANFIDANCSNANFSRAILKYTIFSYSNLRFAVFVNTDFTGADLTGVNFMNANFINANLTGADCTGTNFLYTMFMNTNLTAIHYEGVVISLQHLEKGLFINSLKSENKSIIKLLITEDALYFLTTTNEYKTPKVKILEISGIDKNLKYHVGDVLEASNFNKDTWEYCFVGIYFLSLLGKELKKIYKVY